MNAARHDVGATGPDHALVGGRFHALLTSHDVEGFGSRMRVRAGFHSGREDRFGEMSDRWTNRRRQRADDGSLDTAACRLHGVAQYVEPISGMGRGDSSPSVLGSLRASVRQRRVLADIGLRREEYGTHSLRRTKASIIYKASGNLRAVQILLGHAKIENTVRYLGVDVEDDLALAEGIEV